LSWALHDGVLLCDLLNMVRPNSVSHINRNPSTDVLSIENAALFLYALKSKLKVPNRLLFDPVEVVEGQNLPKIVSALLYLKDGK